MRTAFNSTFLFLALCLATLINAAPPPSNGTFQYFKVPVPIDDTSNDTASTLGYDPSYAHQGWATVAVWTGGSGRKPVNVGNVIDHELHTKVSRTLETSCPSKQTTHGMYCDNLKWQDFQTHYLETPPAGVKETVTWFRTTAAQWATEEIRIIMLNIIGRMLYAYTTQDKGTNCYEVPGQGIFCNIPQFIRGNLPPTSPAAPKWANIWHVEFQGSPYKFSRHGNLKPCSTRAAVDAELDRYRGDLEGQFPEWKGHFKRETRVIINGFKVCSNEP